jgi:enoyl-CoA hydratase
MGSSTRRRSTASSAAWRLCASRRSRSSTAAVGGGLALAAACDLRICTSEAKFALPIARTLGNCLSMANYARLVALIGEARLKELVFTARTVRAEEALAIGLATEVVADGEARVAELCEQMAGHSPITLRVTKEALRRLREAGLPGGDDLVVEAYGSGDFREAVQAFAEKRAPKWRGT